MWHVLDPLNKSPGFVPGSKSPSEVLVYSNSLQRDGYCCQTSINHSAYQFDNGIILLGLRECLLIMPV